MTGNKETKLAMLLLIIGCAYMLTYHVPAKKGGKRTNPFPSMTQSIDPRCRDTMMMIPVHARIYTRRYTFSSPLIRTYVRSLNTCHHPLETRHPVRTCKNSMGCPGRADGTSASSFVVGAGLGRTLPRQKKIVNTEYSLYGSLHAAN